MSPAGEPNWRKHFKSYFKYGDHREEYNRMMELWGRSYAYNPILSWDTWKQMYEHTWNSIKDRKEYGTTIFADGNVDYMPSVGYETGIDGDIHAGRQVTAGAFHTHVKESKELKDLQDHEFRLSPRDLYAVAMNDAVIHCLGWEHYDGFPRVKCTCAPYWAAREYREKINAEIREQMRVKGDSRGIESREKVIRGLRYEDSPYSELNCLRPGGLPELLEGKDVDPRMLKRAWTPPKEAFDPDSPWFAGVGPNMHNPFRRCRVG